MIFRQLFDHESSTYTYLLADRGHAPGAPDRPGPRASGARSVADLPAWPHAGGGARHARARRSHHRGADAPRKDRGNDRCRPLRCTMCRPPRRSRRAGHRRWHHVAGAGDARPHRRQRQLPAARSARSAAPRGSRLHGRRPLDPGRRAEPTSRTATRACSTTRSPSSCSPFPRRRWCTRRTTTRVGR